MIKLLFAVLAYQWRLVKIVQWNGCMANVPEIRFEGRVRDVKWFKCIGARKTELWILVYSGTEIQWVPISDVRYAAEFKCLVWDR